MMILQYTRIFSFSLYHLLIVMLQIDFDSRITLVYRGIYIYNICQSLKFHANDFNVMQEERVLFHYTGHGVPKPTVNGEIWVFNKVCITNDLPSRFILRH